MHSHMNKTLIYCKIRIWHSEQFTITQITSYAQECSITRGCEILSLEMIQNASETRPWEGWAEAGEQQDSWDGLVRKQGCRQSPAMQVRRGPGRPLPTWLLSIAVMADHASLPPTVSPIARETPSPACSSAWQRELAWLGPGPSISPADCRERRPLVPALEAGGRHPF